MPGSQNTSFIPKHTANKIERRNAPRQFFLGTILVRILFFSVLIATAATFFYERKLSTELANQVMAFEEATKSFEVDEERVQMVLAMDQRLKLAAERLNNSVSIVSLLRAIEEASIATVQIEKLDFIRESDDKITLEASILTDTFDSVIFQRSILEKNEVLKSADIADVTIKDSTDLQKEGAQKKKAISFNTSVSIDPKTIPTVVNMNQVSEILIPVVETIPEVQVLIEDENTTSNQESL